MPITRDCGFCGTAFTRPPSHAGEYCSRPCAYAARRKAEPGTKYRMLHRPGHPLAGKSPYIPEHRALLWDKIGPGVHPCHHCSVPLEWLPGSKNRRGVLTVDHVDRNSHNNALENLVPSCQRCNTMNRDMTVEDTEDFRTRPNGTRLRGERRTCEFCAEEYIGWPTSKRDRELGKGRFCSRSCARKAPRR